MRVAHVLPVYSNDGLNLLGGGERYAVNLARAMAHLCSITMVTFGPQYREDEIDGFRHLTIPATVGNPVNPVPRGIGAMLREKFDLIHAYQLRTTVTNILAVACRLTRMPLIVTDLGGSIRARTDLLQLHRLIPRFIAISDYSARLMPRGLLSKTAVVKGGVDVGLFSYREGPRWPMAVQIGRIMPHKGMNYLVDAASDDVEVVIAGKLVSRSYHSDLVERARGKNVRFMIDPTDIQVKYLYQHAAVTVAASVYRDMYGDYRPHAELLGLTLLESMAVGTPVICTAVGGMPEYVEDGRTGFIVSPGDAHQMARRIKELVHDSALVKLMGRAGHDAVQNYSWGHVAANVLMEYERLTHREANWN